MTDDPPQEEPIDFFALDDRFPVLDQRQRQLLVLQRYFLAADSLKQLLLVPVPVGPRMSKMSEGAIATAQFWSAMMRLQVFYSLMYVVIEGYRELGCQDETVDRLLEQFELVDAFRRFRNANFHFQREPFSPKLLEFLEAPASEKWSRDLYLAFQLFFEKNLPMKAYFDAISATDPRKEPR